MANTLFDHGFSGNYPVIVEAQKMKFESIHSMHWGKFVGFTTPDGAAVKERDMARPTASMVSIHNELKRKGGDLLEMPLHRNLTQRGRIGNQQLKDHEERPKVNFAQIPIELYRAAELPMDGSMGKQTTKEIDLVKHARPALQRHYSRFLNWLLCSYSMYYGYSWNVINSDRWANDSKISTASHPHIFLSGRGKVTYSGGYPGTSGYETSVGNEINLLGASDVFDTAYLEGLKADPATMKIPPIIMSHGNELRMIWAHPWQIDSLEKDPRFNTTANHAYVQTLVKENPLLYGMRYVWAGFGIFPFDTGIWPVHVADSSATYSNNGFSSGDVVYGPTDVNKFTDITTFEGYSTYDTFAALMMGSNALNIANGDALEFRKRTDDYGEIMGLAYRVMTGGARNDFWNRDDGTTGQHLVNESSAVLITKASKPAF